MNVVQIEITESFTDKSTNTFVCKGDNYTAYVKADIDKYMVFDCNHRSYEIPSNYVRVLQ